MTQIDPAPKPTSNSERAIRKIKEAYPGARKFRVREEVEIKGNDQGEVCYIEFEDPKDGENEVYVFVSPNSERIFDDVPSLVRFVQGNGRQHGSFVEMMKEILDIGGVAGAVAFIMVGTICALSIVNRELVLKELWQPAIMAIIGFYFGTKTTPTRA